MTSLMLHAFQAAAQVNQTVGNDAQNVSTSPNIRHWKLRSGESSKDGKTVVAVIGDTVTLECDAGRYGMSGWTTPRWTRAKNRWSTDLFLKGILKSRNGSVFTVTIEEINEDDEWQYICSVGSTHYSYVVHVKDTSSCKDDSCSRSNEHCVEATNGYICKCKKGFIGERCELTDPCFDSPCQNGGTCVADGEGYNCICRKGYNGTNCEDEFCTGGICSWSGSCSAEDGKRTCDCSNDKAGDRCQYPCRGLGWSRCTLTCKISFTEDGNREESCECDSVRKRPHMCMLESDVRDECKDTNICNGNGGCNEYMFGYECKCYGNAYGANCQFSGDCRRSDNLCLTYGGTCVNLVKGYKCENCPDGQYGDKCQYKKDMCNVTCQGSFMTADCDMRFLSKRMQRIPVYLNQKIDTCRLSRLYGWIRRVNVSYTDCGTETEYDEDHVIYRNYLRVGTFGKIHEDSNSIITRATGHFSFKMECTIPLVKSSSVEINSISLLLNDTTDLKDYRVIKAIKTNIEMFNANYSREVFKYSVGDRLYAKMSISRKDNPTLLRGFKLHPITCFATPGGNDDGERYTLLEDGCVLDDTFRFETDQTSFSGQREVYFSFDSFSFKSKPGKLYLHCTSRVCINPKGESTSSEMCDVTCTTDDHSKDSTTPISNLATGKPDAMDETITRAPGKTVEIFTPKA